MNLTIVGCGWFGHALALRGLELGWKVWGSVRDEGRARSLGDEGIKGFALDLSDGLYPPVPFADSTVLIAVPALREPAKAALYESGVQRLVEHAIAQSARGVVLISSTSVYEGFSGEVAEFTVPQDTERVLVRVERFITAARVPTCAVRFGGLIGPGRHPVRFLAGRRDLPGGGHPVNLVQRDDCVSAVEYLLRLSSNDWPECMNVVSFEHPTRAEYYPRLARELGLDPPTFLPESDGPGRIVRCGWLDSQGFELLGVAP